MPIYENISNICRERKIPIMELEIMAGLGNGTIGKWKNGDSYPNVRTLTAISKALNVTVNELIKGNE